MAQKDEDGPKDFNSPIVYPNDGSTQQAVYNIRLTFPEDIAVEQSEVSIDVLDSNNEVAIKITSCEVDPWDTRTAVFNFEKIAVEGKDGIEYKEQYLEASGKYTYTIPTGLVKSIDGAKVFEGATYTVTVEPPAPTLSIKDWTPRETTALSEIVLTFDEEITEVKLPESGLEFIYNWDYANPIVVKASYVVSEDKKSATITWDTPFTNPGPYDLTFYAGTFISGELENENTSVWFEVIDPTPSFSLNYEDGSKVQEIGNLEISFKNIAEFDWAEDAGVALYTPTKEPIKGETSKSEDGTRLIVSFEGDLTEEGEYVYFIPAGSFTMDGVLNEDIQILVNLERLVIESLEVVSVTPAVGETEQLEKIVVKFNQPIQLSMDENWQQISREIKLTCDDGKEYILTNDPGFGTNAADELVYLANAEWVDNAYKSTPITVAGVYTLNLADIVVDHAAEEGIDEWGYPATIWHAKNQSCAGSVSWTIGGEGTGIKAVGAEDGGQVIYDLLGRCVEKIVGAGIYIVDGKKVIVK